MTLDRVKRGQSFIVNNIQDPKTRAQAIRFGISEGAVATCEEIIPAGPIVIRSNRQLLALGRGLARQIVVEGLR